VDNQPPCVVYACVNCIDWYLISSPILDAKSIFKVAATSCDVTQVIHDAYLLLLYYFISFITIIIIIIIRCVGHCHNLTYYNLLVQFVFIVLLDVLLWSKYS